jgi:hypothetical protein
MTQNVTGVAVPPSLAFDRSELILPTVPLGFPSVTTFFIKNQGYDNLELKYKLPQDNARVPLTLRFPAGSTLSTLSSSLEFSNPYHS